MKKSVLKYIAAPFIGGAVGLLLLFAVSLIPQSMVQKNASASAHHLDSDHITPKYINIWDWSYASDNHTDTLIMMESYNLDSFQDALLNPYRGVQKYEGEETYLNDAFVELVDEGAENDTVYVLEANPRASRTVPLVSKVCNIRMVPLATEIITSELTGNPSPVPELKEQVIPNYGVKEAVFPFNMFQEVDPVLGPEMRSTGEVLGLSPSYGEAFFKAQEATQSKLPTEGTVLISVNNKDKAEVVDVAKAFHEVGFAIVATGRTHKLITEAGIPAKKINKLSEGGRPNTLDAITNGDFQLIINSPAGKESVNDDSYLRKAAIKGKIPYMTTMAAAKATAEGIRHIKENGNSEVKSLQELHSEIHDK